MAAVSTRREGPVLVVTADDGRANVFAPALLTELHGAFDRAEADDEVRAVVVVGRPGCFSGGFDLTLIQSGDTEAVRAMVRSGGQLVRRAYGSDPPVVAACTGHAVAAGALLLLGSDARFGPDSTDVRIGLNEVAINAVLPDWAMAIAMERLSRRHLQRSVANATLYDGPGAVNAGFLDEVLPVEEVEAAAVTEATRLAEHDTRTYAKTIGILRGSTLARMDADLS